MGIQQGLMSRGEHCSGLSRHRRPKTFLTFDLSTPGLWDFLSFRLPGV